MNGPYGQQRTKDGRPLYKKQTFISSSTYTRTSTQNVGDSRSSLGWWRRGDIRTTNPKKSFEYWVKPTSDIPTGAQELLTVALLAPPHNVGKDEYTVDLGSNEKLYWLDTESGLLGAFGFEGACTARDGSCDVPSTSMGSCFCNVKAMK